jgi:hypothetical protein
MQDNESLVLESLDLEHQDKDVEQNQVESDVDNKVEDESEVAIVQDEDSSYKEDQSVHIKELRRRYRELKKENSELRRNIQPSNIENEVVKKPTLGGCDYDEEEYEKRLIQWQESKRKQDERNAIAKRAEESEKEQWEQKLKEYENLKKALPFNDKEGIEDIVSDYLTKEQMGTIVNTCDNPALVIYALSKNINKLQKVAEIKDYLKFAANVAKVESSIKVNSKKKDVDSEFADDKRHSNHGATRQVNESSVNIKKLIDRALETEDGLQKLMRSRPELRGKILEYI